MCAIAMFISNIILEVLTNVVRQENQRVQKFTTNYLMIIYTERIYIIITGNGVLQGVWTQKST